MILKQNLIKKRRKNIYGGNENAYEKDDIILCKFIILDYLLIDDNEEFS